MFIILLIPTIWQTLETINPHYDDSIEFKFIDSEFNSSTLHIKEETKSVINFGNEEWCVVPDSVQNTSMKYLRLSPSHIADVMSNQHCSSMILKYWVYEICHGRSIRQFHLGGENKAKHEIHNYIGYTPDLEEDVLEVTKEDIRTLRQFERNSFSPEIFVLLNYTGGDVCLFNNISRHALVYYVCFHKEEMAILSMKELDSCIYRFVVGVKDLCHYESTKKEMDNSNVLNCYKDKLPQKSESIFGSENELEDLLKLIDNKFEEKKVNAITQSTDMKINLKYFFNKEECLDHLVSSSEGEAWQYTFCYKKQISQDHLTRKGELMMYSLGTYDHNIGDVIEHDPKVGKVIVQQYFNGTKCDNHGFKRFSTVRMSCDPTVDDHYNMVIREQDVCIYSIKLTSKIFCDD